MLLHAFLKAPGKFVNKSVQYLSKVHYVPFQIIELQFSLKNAVVWTALILFTLDSIGEEDSRSRRHSDSTIQVK